MKTMTFRFTTEAEVTFTGSCYEQMHMQFLAFTHQENNALEGATIQISPPQDSHLFISVDHSPYKNIDSVKGDFQHDILPHTPILKKKSLLLQDWHFHAQ